jgi:hypothetical protein
MSRASTRRDAVRQGGRPAAEIVGLREWIEELQPTDSARAAAFDTRINKPFVPGSAGRAASRSLRRHGFQLVAAPESFRVTGTSGPLVPGEEDRARRWGQSLAALFSATTGD